MVSTAPKHSELRKNLGLWVAPFFVQFCDGLPVARGVGNECCSRRFAGKIHLHTLRLRAPVIPLARKLCEAVSQQVSADQHGGRKARGYKVPGIGVGQSTRGVVEERKATSLWISSVGCTYESCVRFGTNGITCSPYSGDDLSLIRIETKRARIVSLLCFSMFQRWIFGAADIPF